MRLVSMFLFCAAVCLNAADSPYCKLLGEADTFELGSSWDKALTIYSHLAADVKAPRIIRAHSLRKKAHCLNRLGRTQEAIKTYAYLYTSFTEESSELLRIQGRAYDSRTVDSLKGAKNVFPPVPGTSSISKKLRTIRIPRVKFEGALLSAVVKHLREQSIKADPEGKGVNIVVRLRPSEPIDINEEIDEHEDDAREPPKDDKYPEPKITCDFSDISLWDTLRQIARKCSIKLAVEPTTVTVLGPGTAMGKLEVGIFPVDPRLFVNDDDEDPITNYQEFFEEKGVEFPVVDGGERAAVVYDRGTSKLIMHNLPKEIQLVKRILRSGRPVRQVLVRLG